jgi:hypothetical protein
MFLAQVAIGLLVLMGCMSLYFGCHREADIVYSEKKTN